MNKFFSLFLKRKTTTDTRALASGKKYLFSENINERLPKKTKKTLYRWKGVTYSGKKIQGELEGVDTEAVQTTLRHQKIISKNITKKHTIFEIRNPIKSLDITLFYRQMARLLHAGLSLTHSLTIILKTQKKAKMRTLLESIQVEVEKGIALSEVLKQYPHYFNSIFCHLIHIGEHSSSLDIILDRIATYQENLARIKKKILKTLTYPLMILIIAGLVTSVLLILVIPEFNLLFKEFEAELPGLTLTIIKLASFFQAYWLLILITVSLLLYGFFYGKKYNPNLSQQMDHLLLKLPLINSIIENAITARFARILSLTYAVNLPLVKALEMIDGITKNHFYIQGIKDIKIQILQGESLSNAVKNTFLFPNLMIQMISIGEESGTLDLMLEKSAEFYEEEVANQIDRFTQLLEPIVMVSLGLIIGILIIAMYLPIFKLGAII